MRFRSLIERLKLRGATVSTAIAVALLASFLAASPASAMYIDDSPTGEVGEIGSGLGNCLPGYACIWESLIVVGEPDVEHRYYYYGAYNFVGEYGNHTVWNNQTGGARVLLCLGYNGTNCTVTIPAGKAAHGSLTPFNSIVLAP